MEPIKTCFPHNRNLLSISGLIILFLAGSINSTLNCQVERQPAANISVRKFTPVSLDSAPIPDYNFQRANKLPMTGYFEKTFNINGNSRSAKFYIASNAPVRSFFTVITVPEGVETTEFLVSSGWHAIADKSEEGLVLLEPGNGGWGDAGTEEEYINNVLGFYNSNRYFSIFGISYFVGYGKGGNALEAWAAAHPLMVISQAYINTQSQSAAYYDSIKNIYLNENTSGTASLTLPVELKIKCSEVPVPTAFVNSNPSQISRGIAYWKEVNDTGPVSTSSADYFFGADVYTQSADSKAWATAYTGPVSKVITLESDISEINPGLTNKIYDFITEYVSYDNTTAYGNHLAIRKDYGDVLTMIVNDELREFQVYVPEAAERMWPEGAPVVFVFAGNSQTDKVFFHNTLWWKVADNEGCILAIPCETYSQSSTSVSHSNTGMFYEKLADYMTAYYNVDPTRFYATGQSAGSFAVQGFGITNPGYFAAIASTSGLSYPSDEGGFGRISRTDASYSMIPSYCIIGQGDMEMMTGTLWDETDNTLDAWAAYYLRANGVGPVGDGSNIETSGRFLTWTWTNDQGFPLFRVGLTMYRAHNCIPAEMPLLWEFLKHWSYKDGLRFYDGIRVSQVPDRLPDSF